MWTLDFLEAESAQNPYSSITLGQHVYKDWFGWTGAGGNLPPPGTRPWPPPAGTPPKSTGYWTSYQGDVESIVRLTLIRALEVSLGVQHDPGGTPVVPTRHWPIDITWKCAQAWFEGWVWWRRIGPSGVVILVFATPSSGTGVYKDIGAGKLGPANPLGYRNPVGDRENLDGSGLDTRNQGMWVISHEGNDQSGFKRQVPSPSGDYPGVGILPVTRGVGDVITWALAEVDGGVLPDGRSYP